MPWHHGAHDPHFFLTICLIWYSINNLECKIEFNFDDSLSLTTFYLLTFNWKCGFFRVTENSRFFFQRIYPYKQKSPNIISIDHKLLARSFIYPQELIF